MEQREDGFKKQCLSSKASLDGERGNDLYYSFHFTLSQTSQCGGVIILGASALGDWWRECLGISVL